MSAWLGGGEGAVGHTAMRYAFGPHGDVALRTTDGNRLTGLRIAPGRAGHRILGDAVDRERTACRSSRPGESPLWPSQPLNDTLNRDREALAPRVTPGVIQNHEDPSHRFLQ